jgi:biotin carboxyl carrier protein
VTVDGHTWSVDVARIDAQSLSLIVDRARPQGTVDGAAAAPSILPAGAWRPGFDIVVVPERAAAPQTVHVGTMPVAVALNGRRRWGRTDEGVGAGSGPLRLVAPMPGKVVRVLVTAGEVVRARQPLVVVEAMKMENELRAARDGTVVDIQAREGMSVDAGALLVVIQ